MGAQKETNPRKTIKPIVITAIMGAVFGLIAAGMSHMPVILEGIFTSIGSHDDVSAFNARMQTRQFLENVALYVVVGAIGFPSLLAIVGGILSVIESIRNAVMGRNKREDDAA
ncbi:hypothetical protein KUW00_06540 [Halomonas sp. DP5N14-9]|uniref:hypothetical protein n=1 Tax=Halomonas sp. DP5N14-9 TaxID=2859075 RepID=UPI001C99D6DA|nr:hypothetical protein [Halomonas sp. DP5N14-9]MBY5940540.1 hypothetical protein [Halomonas sp. DP5N14-9]